MSEESKYIIEFLNCDFEMFDGKGDIEKVVNRFNELSKQGKEEGFYPVILIPTDTLAETLEFNVEEAADNSPNGLITLRNETISKANEIKAEEFLQDRLNEYMDDYRGFDILGDLKQQVESTDLSGYLKQFIGYYDELIIVQIPTINPWELAAWIPMGGFNDCPLPEEQVAVFRYWHEQYNAIPILVTFDTWMLSLTEPPETDEEVELLAKEQFAFCSDIVTQGAETILGLASALRNEKTWFFWWD